MVQKLKLALKTGPWYSLASGIFGAALVWLFLPTHPAWFVFLVVLATLAAKGWKIFSRLLLLFISLGVVLVGGGGMAAFLFGITAFLIDASNRGRFLLEDVAETIFAASTLLFSQAWYSTFASPAAPEGAAWSYAFLYSALLPLAVIFTHNLFPQEENNHQREALLLFILFWQLMVAVWLLPSPIYIKSTLFTGFAVCGRGILVSGNNNVAIYNYLAIGLFFVAVWAVLRTSVMVF